VVTHGCTEALTLALRAVANPGDVIAVESPTYDEFKLEVLSTSAISTLPSDAETMLSGLLSSVGERLLQYRKKDCPATLE
ncbi:MAG TPA: PLP-dependent aminotransferase family protein, partial [Gammaproteobacteria bacterium]|nr:PLP-dependent aminotransferase family protein [Gammaproteobacteria bacterium]